MEIVWMERCRNIARFINFFLLLLNWWMKRTHLFIYWISCYEKRISSRWNNTEVIWPHAYLQKYLEFFIFFRLYPINCENFRRILLKHWKRNVAQLKRSKPYSWTTARRSKTVCVFMKFLNFFLQFYQYNDNISNFVEKTTLYKILEIFAQTICKNFFVL